jgi:hypothetical protein
MASPKQLAQYSSTALFSSFQECALPSCTPLPALAAWPRRYEQRGKAQRELGSQSQGALSPRSAGQTHTITTHFFTLTSPQPDSPQQCHFYGDSRWVGSRVLHKYCTYVLDSLTKCCIVQSGVPWLGVFPVRICWWIGSVSSACAGGLTMYPMHLHWGHVTRRYARD